MKTSLDSQARNTVHNASSFATCGLAALLSLSAFGCKANSTTNGDAGAGGGGGGDTNNCVAGAVHTQRQLRRLTRFEYDNSVSDLFQITSTWGQTFPPDDVVGGFDNNGPALRVGPLLADNLLTAGEGIATQVAPTLGTLWPCTAAAMDDACARSVISDLGTRAFRRPITQAESDRYFALHTSVMATDTFSVGIQAVITAMMQSPNFLYRTELGSGSSGATIALTDYEIATELSYLFWASTPDAILMAAAATNTLHTAGQIAAQAQRLLASPKSRPMLDHFATQWLELSTTLLATKDPTVYPDFTPDIQQAMVQESLDLFAHVITGGGTGMLPELFLTTDSYMSPSLAQFYGITTAPAELLANGTGRWDVSAMHRGGLLTHGSILAAQAKPDSSSPVLRGKIVREQFLCDPLPPPPAGLNLQLPPVDPNQTNRARFTAHDVNPTCASCHHLMDPIGFGFERYDAVGRYMETQAGMTIDDSGNIEDSDHTEGPFQGVLDLESKLANSPDVSGCFAQQWVLYGYGIPLSQASSCLIQSANTAFTTSNLKIADLLVAITQEPDFRMRLPDPAATTDSGDMAGSADSDDGGMSLPPPADMTLLPDLSTGSLGVQLFQDSSWATGYCNRVIVTNNGTSTATWSVTLPVAGTINNLWNAVSAPAGGMLLQFSGASYDLTLAPAANVTFGWCATLM